MKADLLREIVEIAGESTAERILRKLHAASGRLITDSSISYSLDDSNRVNFESENELKPEDLDIAITLAISATHAIANALGNDLAVRMQINEERLRIARDLHDRVLQRIFATGISLEGALRKAVKEDVIIALRQAIVDLDETVGQIRTTVHSLKGPVGSIKQRILGEIEIARRAWDLTVDFNLRGPIDLVIPNEMHADIIAVTTELLSNCGKHGKRGVIKYNLNVTGNSLEVSVRNNSGDFRPIKFGSGLENLSDRANKYGGELTVENLQPGLLVVWKVAL